MINPSDVWAEAQKIKKGNRVAPLLVVHKNDINWGKSLAGEFELLIAQDNELVNPGEFMMFPNQYAHAKFKK